MLTPGMLETSNLCWVPWAWSWLAISISFFRVVPIACTLENSPLLGLRLGQGPVEDSPMVVDHKRGPGWAYLTH